MVVVSPLCFYPVPPQRENVSGSCVCWVEQHRGGVRGWRTGRCRRWEDSRRQRCDAPCSRVAQHTGCATTNPTIWPRGGQAALSEALAERPMAERPMASKLTHGPSAAFYAPPVIVAPLKAKSAVAVHWATQNSNVTQMAGLKNREEASVWMGASRSG